MKRSLALTLSFLVFSSGLVSLAAPQDRVAAFKRRAMPRPDARANVAVAENSRDRISALRRRRLALANYLLTTTPSSADYQATRRAIEVLDGQLLALSGEQTTADATPARDQGTNDAPDGSAQPDGIQFVSPSEDTTVHVSQYEVQVNVGDEDVDDIMVAVYTKRSGEKPATARTMELKRSEHGKKSFVLALEEGTNRIEVSDLKRQTVLAKRTITYAPLRDVLNSADDEGAALAADAAAAAAAPLPANAAAGGGGENAPAHANAVVCGQIQLASLNRTLALIKATPELADLSVRFRMRGDPLITSALNDNCDLSRRPDGSQKAAVVDLLSATLMRLNSDLSAKNVLPNRIALRKRRANLLERTTTDPDIKALADNIRTESDETESRLLTGGAHDDELTLTRGSEFNTLSTDTIKKQIDMLEQFLGNVDVLLTDKDGHEVGRVRANHDGNFIFTVPFANDTAQKLTVATAGDDYNTTGEILVRPGDRQRVNLEIEDRPASLLARTIIGYDQSGAAAAKHEQNYFLDFFVSKSFPFRQKINPDFGERLRLWGDFRINSIPQSGEATVGDFAGGFATQVSGLHIKDVARVFEFLGGVEYRLTGNNALWPSFDRKTKQKFSLSFIGAFGSVTPVDPLEKAPTVFKVFDAAPGLPPAAKGKEFVAFVPTDRDRFFRQYYAGLRVQTFFFNKYNVPMQRFPAQFDLTVGQNEFVTGGRYHGPVIRMESFFPLPYENAKFINLFASATMIPGRPTIGTPLVLQPAPDGTIVPGANVALISVPQPNRDYYRIGFGIDAIALFQKLLQSKNSGGAAAATAATAATAAAPTTAATPAPTPAPTP
jgi:hypothetical protein